MNKKQDNPINPEQGEDLLDVAAVEDQLRGVDDPLLAILRKYSNYITYGLLAVIISYVGLNYYEKTKQQNLRTSAKLFAELRSAYQAVSDKSGELTDEDQANLRQFQGTISTLKGQPAPYDYIASTYQTIGAKDLSTSQIKSELAKIDLSKISGEQRIWAELTVLSLSRKLLDTEEGSYASKQLKALAENSVYFKDYLAEVSKEL